MLAVRPLLSPRPSLLPPPPPPPPPPLPSPPRSSRPRLAALRLAARPTPDRFYLAAASSLYRLLSLSTPPTDSSLCAPRAVSSLRRGGGSTTQLGQQRRTCSNYSERATKADVISRSFPFLDRFDLSRICLASGVDIDRVSINRARCCSFTPTFTFDLRLESKEPNRSKHEIGKKELS